MVVIFMKWCWIMKLFGIMKIFIIIMMCNGWWMVICCILLCCCCLLILLFVLLVVICVVMCWMVWFRVMLLKRLIVMVKWFGNGVSGSIWIWKIFWFMIFLIVVIGWWLMVCLLFVMVWYWWVCVLFLVLLLWIKRVGRLFGM